MKKKAICAQRIAGIVLLAISVIAIFLTLSGFVDLNSELNPCVLTIPLGVFLCFSKKVVFDV